MKYIKYFKFLSKSLKKRKKMLSMIASKAGQAIGPQLKGRRRSDMQHMIAGILYYLRSGCTWEMLPNDFGPHQTVYGWYVRLCGIKFFDSLFKELKKCFFKKDNKKVRRLCTDGSLVQHCKKNELTSINPRNKNKASLNRLLTTNEDGLPLSTILARGTAHDSIFFNTSFYLASQDIRLAENWEHHADKGFDYKHVRKTIRASGGTPRIPHRQIGSYIGFKEPKDSHRFVVERTFAWTNAFKNLKIVFIKRSDRISEMINFFNVIAYSRRFSKNEIINLQNRSAF